MKKLAIQTAEQFERRQQAPPLPSDRPPTRKEVWDHFSFIFPERERDDLAVYCREAWVWYYVEAYNFRGWRKQPDWTEEDPVIDAAVPTEPFYPGSQKEWERRVYLALQAGEQMEVAA